MRTLRIELDPEAGAVMVCTVLSMAVVIALIVTKDAHSLRGLFAPSMIYCGHRDWFSS